MVNLPKVGLRPRVDKERCETCGTCLRYCPGISLERSPRRPDDLESLWNVWGPIRSLWEGYAGDAEIRYLGSSGGIATAVALYCLEQEGAAGVFHIRENPDSPLENAAVFSRDRSDLLGATGSRYCPAELGSAFGRLEQMPGPCVVMGKPCDIEALVKACDNRPALKEKVFLTISIFCAGTPTLEGTVRALERMGVPREQVQSLRYRGCGWPGMMTARRRDGGPDGCLSYREAWGEILSRHGQLRCRLCPDSTGEYADLSCGDPWYQEPDGQDPGRSLVLVRTRRGEAILQRAARRKDVIVEPSRSEEVLTLSQPSLCRRHCELWGRRLAFRLCGVPFPEYAGFPLAAAWRTLPLKGKIRSVLGTLKRIVLRRYDRPQRDLYEDDVRKEAAAWNR